MKKILMLGIVVAMAVSTISGCSNSQKNQGQSPSIVESNGDKGANDSNSDGYVATVGEDIVTENEYKYFLASTKMYMEQQAGVFDEQSRIDFWEGGDLGGQPLKAMAKQFALENVQEYKIILNKAKEEGIKINDEELQMANQQLDIFIDALGGGELGKQAFENMYGVPADYIYQMNPDLALVQKYTLEKIQQMTHSDDELREFYEQNKDYYQTVTVRHILFLTNDAVTGEPLPQEQQDEAKRKAEDILARVNAGEDMKQLAMEYTEDTGSKETGGEYTFIRGEMVKEFEDWSFNAKEGETGIVKTDYGYHVMRLEKILQFEDLKIEIQEDLSSKKYSELVQEWKKDPKYEIKENKDILDNITI